MQTSQPLQSRELVVAQKAILHQARLSLTLRLRLTLRVLQGWRRSWSSATAIRDMAKGGIGSNECIQMLNDLVCFG